MEIIRKLMSKLRGTPEYSARGQAALRDTLIEHASSKIAQGLTNHQMPEAMATFTITYLEARWGIDAEGGDALAAREVCSTLEMYALVDDGPPASPEEYADWVLEALNWSWQQPSR